MPTNERMPCRCLKNRHPLEAERDEKPRPLEPTDRREGDARRAGGSAGRAGRAEGGGDRKKGSGPKAAPPWGPQGPRKRIKKAPPMSGTPYPPTAWRRSTFGEEGLSFRVRNGIGRSPSLWFRSWGALPRTSFVLSKASRVPAAPWRLHARSMPRYTVQPAPSVKEKELGPSEPLA